MGDNSFRTYTPPILFCCPARPMLLRSVPGPRRLLPLWPSGLHSRAQRGGGKEGSISPLSGTLPRSGTYHLCSYIGQNLVTMPHQISRGLRKYQKCRQPSLLVKKWRMDIEGRLVLSCHNNLPAPLQPLLSRDLPRRRAQFTGGSLAGYSSPDCLLLCAMHGYSLGTH